MATLSYIKPAPQSSAAALLTASLLFGTVGLLNAWEAVRSLPLHNWMVFRWVHFERASIWGCVFICFAVVVRRATVRIRLLVLSTIPVYVAIRLNESVVDLYFGHTFYVHAIGMLPRGLMELGPLLMSAIAWILVEPWMIATSSEIEQSFSKSRRTPTPLNVWALACVIFGTVDLIEWMIFYSGHGWVPFSTMLSIAWVAAILTGGLLTLLEFRNAWIVSVFSMFAVALQALAHYLAIQNFGVMAAGVSASSQQQLSGFYLLTMTVSVGTFVLAGTCGWYVARMR